MIDLHTHTTFSDGVLIPAESARRAKQAGYEAIAFTDHADHSNLHLILDNVRKVADAYSPYANIDLFHGVEITHVPAGLIADLTARARRAGAQLVVVHGETPVEPVEPGTNLAAINAGVNILAHPGLITADETRLAAERGVYLEITTRKGHSLTNGHVAKMAREYGAKLVINNDFHEPGDYVSKELRKTVALGAGLTPEEYLQAEANSRAILQSLISLVA
ncbi:MAG: histidinol phosphate phosphatase domain-containing protein [Desulfovibrionaceae bacterium]|jgi:histidinol phosphatase-like PHP family hydrolase|nr:histidinol phosphate phosphatase domain-containing protein [Desulfovibrionaceae bacterium]